MAEMESVTFIGMNAADWTKTSIGLSEGWLMLKEEKANCEFDFRMDNDWKQMKQQTSQERLKRRLECCLIELAEWKIGRMASQNGE